MANSFGLVQPMGVLTFILSPIATQCSQGARVHPYLLHCWHYIAQTGSRT